MDHIKDPLADLEPRARDLVVALRSQCVHRGCGAFKQIGLTFRLLDIDYSKTIILQELAEGIGRFNLNFCIEDLQILFNALDKDKNGQIEFEEFMSVLSPPMSKRRLDVTNEVFDRLDTNGDGVLTLEELEGPWAKLAKNHPKYLSGEWTEEQTLRRFINEYDTDGVPDGKISRKEFLHYYSGVSSTVDDDAYYVLMLGSAFNLPHRKM